MKTNPHFTTTATKVASFKPHQDPNISTYDTTSWSDMDYAADRAWKKYRNAVEVYRFKINNTLKHLYGERTVHFEDNYVSEMIYGINEIMEVAGKDIKDVAKEFRSYLGYPCQFFRRENNKTIPVEHTRIIAAYKAMKERQIIKKIEKILYY